MISSYESSILPRVAELLNHKEKQGGCRLLDAYKHTYRYRVIQKDRLNLINLYLMKYKLHMNNLCTNEKRKFQSFFFNTGYKCFFTCYVDCSIPHIYIL